MHLYVVEYSAHMDTSKIRMAARCVSVYGVSTASQVLLSSSKTVACSCTATRPPVVTTKAPAVTCSHIQCRMLCRYGFAKDQNGCEICRCNPRMTNDIYSEVATTMIINTNYIFSSDRETYLFTSNVSHLLPVWLCN